MLLLADAVQRGEVALTDPVSQFLPTEVKLPERGGRKITLLDLAAHTSALPRLPSNFAPKDPADPYAHYTVRQLYDSDHVADPSSERRGSGGQADRVTILDALYGSFLASGSVQRRRPAALRPRAGS